MRYAPLVMLVVLSACAKRDYAWATGEASVRFVPVDGEGFTIEQDGLEAGATDTWDHASDSYDQRVVGIRGVVPSPGPCFAGDAELEIEVRAEPSLFVQTVEVTPNAISGYGEEPGADPSVDDWAGEYAGHVELWFGDDDPCEVPQARHVLEFTWTIDEATWTEHWSGPGDLWPPVPAGY